MRRCSQQLCLLVFALLTTGICRAQNAAKIIEQWEKAEGGAKSLAKVQTLLVDGAVQSPGDESSGTYTFRVKLPNQLFWVICVSQGKAMRRLALPPLPLCLMVLPLIFPGVGYAQDASKIIDQYAKAAGGTKNLGKVQTLLIDGSIQAVGEETPGTYSFRVKLPNRYYTELRSGGKTMILAYNGKSAWHQAESAKSPRCLEHRRWKWKRRHSITTLAG